MLDFLQSILGGGMTGILGAALTIWGEVAKGKLDIEKTKLSNEFELQKATLDIQQVEMEGRMKLELSRVESEAALAQAQQQVFSDSYAADKAQYATGSGASNSGWFIFVDTIRGLIRPSLTIYLMAVVTIIYADVSHIAGGIGAFPEAEAVKIFHDVTLQILYLGTTVALWWFGIRGARKAVL